MSWPRTLVGRHALLLVGLLLLGQLLGVSLVSRLVFQPRVEHLAELAARQVEAVQAGLAGLPVAQRQAFVARFNRNALAAAPPTASPRAPWMVLRLRLDDEIIAALSERLAGQQMRVRPEPERPGSLLITLPLDGQLYQIVLPEVVPDRSLPGALVTMTAVGVLLALASALWLQRRLHRPLARVVAAAEAVARDERPPALSEDGPLEIATLGRSFNRLVRSLSDAEQERGVMLAGISHDLRTPLTKLRLYVELLPPATEAELREGMVRGIDQIDEAVGQFLDFARPESAEPDQPLFLHALGQEVAWDLADPQHAVTLDLAPVPPVLGRPRALRRVLSNLLGNAWRHGQAPVSLHTGQADGGVWIEVRDQGPGIAAADAQRLRQPFVRGEAARGGAPGTGLGLAIVERIAQLHGGRLELRPGAQGGLCARLWLPAAPASGIDG